MGGMPDPVRLATGLLSFGTSELFQKKPFQRWEEDRPIGGASASPLRFIPGGATVAGLADSTAPQFTGQSPAEQEEEERARSRTAEQQRTDAAKKRALEPRPQASREAEESRRRAMGASEKLGGGRRRRASQTLTDPGDLLSGSLAGSYGP